MHQCGNHLEVVLLEQDWSGFEPRVSGFKTDHSTIEPSHLVETHIDTETLTNKYLNKWANIDKNRKEKNLREVNLNTIEMHKTIKLAAKSSENKPIKKGIN